MTKNLVSNSTRFLMLVAFCFALSIGQTFAQAESSTGQITGVITDASGALVPNASVTIVNKGTNQTQTATTNDDGVYRFVLLQPGLYTVKASSTGFAEQVAEVQVQVGRTLDANFTLGAAGAQAEVTVTAEGIQTTTSNSDAVINETAINNLPINGRRFQDFVTLTPTAQVEGSRGQISLAGQRGINGNVNVDGVDFNQPFFGGIRGGERSNQAFTIPQEAIKEFQVVASGYTAEFGRSTGGIVNAVTKSGSNDLRGSLFYLLRPEKFARGNEYIDALQSQRLNALGIEASVAPTQTQFGGSIGGRIVRDKLFFFGSYEQQRFRADRQVLIANLIGLDLSPTTGIGRGIETYNYLRTLETPYLQSNDAKAFLGRIDWNVNNSNRLNVRFSHSRNDAPNAAATGETALDPTTNNAVSSNGLEKDRTKIGVGQLISNFGTSTVNELRVQYAREDRPREANVLAPNVFFGTNFAQYGSRNFLPTTQYDTRYQIADAVTYVSGNHTAKFGGEFSRIFANQTFGFNQFGAYTLSTGTIPTILRNVSSTREGNYLGRFDDTNANYQRQIGNLQTDVLVKELAFFAQDSWRVTPNLTFNYGLRAEQQYNPEADISNTAIVNLVRNTRFPFRNAGFDPGQVPDSGWQFGPRFGFAYDFIGDGKTVLRGFAGIYYARTPGLIFADTTNNYRATPGNVSARVPVTGFNQATFNTFVASAAGAQYRAITGCDPVATPGAGACVPNTLYRQFAIVGVNLNSFALSALPNVTPEQIAAIASALGQNPSPFSGATVTGHDENFKNPRSYQFGFAVEREVSKNLVLGLDYTYVKTDRLQRNRDLNVPTALTGTQYVEYLRSVQTTADFNAMVANGLIDSFLRSGRTYIAINAPGGRTCNGTTITTECFPNSTAASRATRLRPTNDPALNSGTLFNLGSVQVRESTARSLYQALTMRMRLVRSWGQLNAYYTLSNNLSDDDNERDSGGVAYANPYDLRSEYGPSRLDRRHQFVANPVFFLPYGFEASSAIRLRSGTPINAYAGADLNGDNVFNDRPIFGFGEINRNYFRNNPLYDVDVRFQKRISFSENTRLVLSAEIFNVFNRPNIVFQFPGTNGTSGALAQYCLTGSQLCGLNGVQNPNFLQIREQSSTSSNFGNINLATNPGSQAFQVQLGARFQF